MKLPWPKELVDKMVDPSSAASLLCGQEVFSSNTPSTIFPVVRGIPRFVPSDAYVGSFSFEWNTHSRTQLDSIKDSQDSEEMFVQKTGFIADDLAGKWVLDAGVGAGRFADVVSRWGANLVGVDLSFAVEAAAANFADRNNVFILQADIGSLPFREESFDFIYSIGVLHHTPNTREYFLKLPRLLKPGGEIAIWVYPNEGEYVTRNAWIPFTSRIPPKWFHRWCQWFVPWVHSTRLRKLAQLIRHYFPFSDQGLGMENDILDTFDGYSPSYHGIHSAAEVRLWFEEAGLEEIHEPGSWKTSMRGRRPAF
jgi:SAM-dependent methyltransferase